MSNHLTTEPTPFHILAAVIRGTGKTTLKSSTVPFSTRLPEYLLAKLDAMGAMAGKSRNAMLIRKSRNAMLIHLLDTCFEQTADLLDPETAKRFNDLTTENLHKMAQKNSDRESFEG